jgi:hypothetical protein
MSASKYGDNVLYQLAQTLAGGGRHSTATALRLLAQAGYTTLEEVDAASDWILLSIRGMGMTRLKKVRQLTRTDWKPPSPQAVHTANWFLSSVRFALRYWSPETLISLIRGSAPRTISAGPIEKRLAIDVLSQAVRRALHHCGAEELVQALRQADGRPGGSARQTTGIASNPCIRVEELGARQASPSISELSATSSRGGGPAGDSDRYAYSPRKRREIVQHYRAVRDSGLIENKDRWAHTNYNITGRTLLNYEREFPEVEQGAS